jgi:hypothetical protein
MVVYFLGANPAIHSIFCGEHRHKRMPLLSGLGQSFSNENKRAKITLFSKP